MASWLKFYCCWCYYYGCCCCCCCYESYHLIVQLDGRVKGRKTTCSRMRDLVWENQTLVQILLHFERLWRPKATTTRKAHVIFLVCQPPRRRRREKVNVEWDPSLSKLKLALFRWFARTFLLHCFWFPFCCECGYIETHYLEPHWWTCHAKQVAPPHVSSSSHSAGESSFLGRKRGKR